MNRNNKWILPAGIEEKLPPDAEEIDCLRRKILDLFSAWGYELVLPPIVEYADSLVIGDDEELNAQTLKLTDTADGRILGLRADMTPQVARIDAHRMTGDEIRRLCYIGTVLRAQPQDVKGTRALLQFGAEIYGHAGIGSSVESIRLMVAVLEAIGIKKIHVDIGHAGIYSALSKAAGLDAENERYMFKLIQVKAAHEIHDYLQEQDIQAKYRDWFIRLIELYGDVDILTAAKQIFQDNEEVIAAITELEAIGHNLEKFGIMPKYDLGEMGSYFYETGVVFSVFVQGLGQEIVHGGRYDNIGETFGRARPAVGFSSDLLLLKSLSDEVDSKAVRIHAPCSRDNPALQKKIASLRSQGERVVEDLDETAKSGGDKPSRRLVQKGNDWVVADN